MPLFAVDVVICGLVITEESVISGSFVQFLMESLLTRTVKSPTAIVSFDPHATGIVPNSVTLAVCFMSQLGPGLMPHEHAMDSSNDN